MTTLSQIVANYRKTKRLMAESALRRGKRRFLIVSIIEKMILGCIVVLLVSHQGHDKPALPFSWTLTEFAWALPLMAVFGYLSAQWQWKDYERLVSSSQV